jgi:hypothetical protein
MDVELVDKSADLTAKFGRDVKSYNSNGFRYIVTTDNKGLLFRNGSRTSSFDHLLKTAMDIINEF